MALGPAVRHRGPVRALAVAGADLALSAYGQPILPTWLGQLLVHGEPTLHCTCCFYSPARLPSPLNLRQVLICPVRDGGGSIAHAQFSVDVFQVLGDGAGADLKGMGDGQIGAAEGDQSKHSRLGFGQISEAGVVDRDEGCPRMVP
jgi:hypothetical protein